MGMGVGDPAGLVMLCIIGGIFGAVAVSNLLQGPTCECQLRTAVQTEKLVSLGRLRNALKALEILRPRIVAAQGELTVEQLYAKNQEELFAAAEDPDAPPIIAGRAFHPPAPAIKPPPQPYRSKMHFVLFCLLVADLPITALNFAFPDSKAMDVFAWGLFLTTVGFLIAALVKQSNTDLSQTVKRITWASLVVLGVSLVTAFGYAFFVVMDNPSAFENRTVRDDPVNIVMSVLFTGTTVALGIMGFLHLRKYRAAVNIPPPMTIPPPSN
jgi:hypothetical protein